MSYLSVETHGGGTGGAGLSGGRLRMTPGRVASLVLGVPIAIALITVLCLSAVSALDIEHFPVNATFPVANNQVIAKIDGNLTVRQDPASSSAQLTGTATYSLFRSEVTFSGTTVRYRCRWGMGDCSLNGTLTVPSQADVTLTTGGGDVTMGSYTANRTLTLNLDGGNLDAGAVYGTMRVRSSGGDVTVTTLDGPVQLDTSGGNINIGAVTSTLGGTIQSDGGDVTMTFTKVPANLTIYSNGGNVRLVLPPNGTPGYAYDVTTNGGNENAFPSRNPRSPDKITVASDGGDVTIN